MVMTLRKITAGDGYLYLIRQVAHGDAEPVKNQDATAYYAASGNPPGKWTGRGAHLLGLDGEQVTEDQMRALLGYGQHPDADVIIAAYIAGHTRAGMTPQQISQVKDQAIAAARLGRPFPAYEPLDPYDHRVGRRLAVISKETGRDPTDAEIKKIRAGEARRQRAAVAGFDLVFSPVKSAALLWAIDERPHVRAAIRHAHEQAIAQAMDLIEDHAAYTRTGTGGIAQIGTHGLTAAAFEHWDSRAGDPDLHTHVAVSSKVMGTDGHWRSLDARSLYRITVAASECYNTAFEVALTSLLGVTFTTRDDTAGAREPVREISHVPFSMIRHFSRRRAQLNARYQQLTAGYRREHGRDPDPAACHKLAQQACLDTRPGKQPPRSLHERRAQWRDELVSVFGPGAVQQVMAAVPPRAASARPAAPDVQELAEHTVANVSSLRSTWTIWNLRAEAERLLRTRCQLPSLAEHRQAAAAVTTAAVALSVCTDAPALLDEPPALRRDDGESVFGEHAAGRYTSHAVLDAEHRLLTATTAPAASTLKALTVTAALDGYEAAAGTTLDPGQRHLVTAFASDPRLLLAGIGPAGTGKTTAMRALAHVLRQHRHRLIPLATSAASAAVLGRELRVQAENLHKFLHEWDHGPHAARLRGGSHLPPGARFFQVHPGDVILVDEAGLAGTFLLDRLVQLAAARGAIVRLLGDDRQLSAVESGGALRLIAAQPGTPQLTTVHRFRDPAEAAATLQLRTGDTTAITWYQHKDRIRTGSRDAMTQAAYDGWKHDMLAGKTTLMAAGAGTDVVALAARARADRVTAGQVEPGGVPLHDGTLAGAGDWIVTRDNRRQFGVHGGRDWVKNGDAWHVQTRHQDGSLTCAHLGHQGRVRLPAAYVAEHVELLYATTAHRAQGATVDTAHPLVTAGMTREMLYVLASRAREHTTFYVTTHDLLPLDDDERVNQAAWDRRSYAAREILKQILATEGSEPSATQTIRDSQELAGSLATLVPQYLHVAHSLAERRYADAAVVVFGRRDGELLVTDPAWGALVRRLYAAEADGWQPERLLGDVARLRELDTADSVAEVFCWRIDRYIRNRVPPAHLRQPARADAARYAGLLTGHPAFSGMTFDAEQALAVPSAFTVTRRDDGADTPAGYLDLVAEAIGATLTRRAVAEAAWPAVETALRRARQAGHDPAAVLSIVARGRELRTARTISQTLAWRIGRYLASSPDPVASMTGPVNPDTWRTLAWTLKAAETAGTSAGSIIAAVRHARRLADLLAVAQNAARQQAACPGAPELPWLRRPVQPTDGTDHPEQDSYLSEAATLISARVNYLAGQAERDRPAWTRLLGQPPADEQQRELWRHQLGIISAYRDQHQITSDDPHQVLGPYPEPGHAGHAAYWHAVRSVLAARYLAGLEPAAADAPDQVTAQIAADIYRALPDAERTRVRASVAGRSGPLRFGPAELNDDAVTQPASAGYLVQVLAENSQITATRPRPAANRPVEADLAQRPAARRPRRRPAPGGPEQRMVPKSDPQSPHLDVQPHQQRVTVTP